MSTPEATERKGKYFKAIVTTPTGPKKPKKVAPRTLPTLQPKQCRPVDRSSSMSKIVPGPTGEASAAAGSTDEEASSILENLDETTDAKHADRCADDVRNLTKLLFNRSFTGFLKTDEKLEDIAIIQTIFNANNGSKSDVEDSTTHTPTEVVASQTEPVLPSSNQPSAVCSAQSEPTQVDQSTSTWQAHGPLLVQEQQRDFLKLAKCEAKDDVVRKNAKLGVERRNLGRQRTVSTYPKRLPKLGTQPRDTVKTDICSKENDGICSSDMVCCGTTNLKRPRYRQMTRRTELSEAADHPTNTAVSYPCPSNLTIIQRRGHHTTTRVCSPMPAPRKPLPPIRRRHHSDICTVCPKVHDWKGLARNPRWYPSKPDRQCLCDTRRDIDKEPCVHSNEVQEKEVDHTETVNEKEVQSDRKHLEEEDKKMDEARSNMEEEGNWFPERSIAADENPERIIPVEESEDPGVDDKPKDESLSEYSSDYDAIRNTHCPWLVTNFQLDDKQEMGLEENERKCTKQTDDDKLQAKLMMAGMDFEGDSKTRYDFEEDNTLLQAVFLRNLALNHGTVSESGDPRSPSENSGQEVVKSDKDLATGCTETHEHPEDRDMLLNCCQRFQESSRSNEKASHATHLGVHRQVSEMLTPKAEVIITSRGQQKIVSSSLVAVGKGQSGCQLYSREEVPRLSPKSDPTRDDSSEALLQQEMKRYLHSLRHDNARQKHHHGLSSAQNIPMRVQNLTAVRPITADVTNSSVLTDQVTKAVGFIPILTKDEYESLSKKAAGPPTRFPKTPALPPIITGNPSGSLIIKRFDGEVEGKQLPCRRERKNKK